MNIDFIDRFQFENLFLGHVGFLFLDVSQSEAPAPQGFELHWQRRHQVDVGDVAGFVAEHTAQKDFPIVIVCESGQTSSEAARALASDGYTNVYVVEGGWASL